MNSDELILLFNTAQLTITLSTVLTTMICIRLVYVRHTQKLPEKYNFKILTRCSQENIDNVDLLHLNLCT